MIIALGSLAFNDPPNLIALIKLDEVSWKLATVPKP